MKTGSKVIINSRKIDGSIRRFWDCDLVRAGSEVIDLVGSFEARVEHVDLGVIEAGTVSHERFYLSRWYNYFVFHHPNGDLRNLYINICMPPAVGDHVIDYVDLDIDVIVWPDGRVATLDMDEFERNAVTLGYPDDVKAAALSTLAEIVETLSDATDIHVALARL